ncbi:MAG: InlB B-repeat-containing protein [Clostridia bacterium]|nr:InlB B-repeat-containing protein [Clostridia bacterium]
MQNHVFTSGFSKTGSSDPSKYFKSGVTGYGLYLKDNEIAFGQSVTVTFDKNSDDATGTMEAQNILKGTEAALSANGFARAKYTFDSWNTAADGTGTKYADKAKVTLSTDITLYAIWTQMPAATVTRAPAANNLTYTGSAQKLVTAGEATGGKMQYALGDNATTAPTDESLYTTSIPAKTDAGTYYVWYKVKGDNNHTDTTPVCIPVTISGSKGIHSLPQTGDTERPLLYGLAFLAACIGLGLLIRKK